MEKRKIIFGTYDTSLNGWTLTEWIFEAPVYKANFVSVPGRDGDLDLSTSLTGGEPVYNSRMLTATFESSEETRLIRETIINTMVNKLDGIRMKIYIPDDNDHYLEGRVHVEKKYNDIAHASVIITAVCDPWRYSKEETTVTISASTTEMITSLQNDSKKSIVPLIEVTSSSIHVTYGEKTWDLSKGKYKLPDFCVPPGTSSVKYKEGTAIIKYRQVIL